MAAIYKVVIGLAVLTLIAAGVLFSRIFLYARDLPDIEHLSEFAPDSANQVTDTCLPGVAFAIPVDRIGKSFRDALASAEPSTSLADQIARTLLCATKWRGLRYQLDVFRLSWHIRRRFSDDEVFTIYANRAYFGPAATGIENASYHFFQKSSDTLSVEEAALLAGLLRGPGMYSPFKHPDMAIQRRNEILRRMSTQRKLGAAELARATAAPVVTRSLGNTEAKPLPSGVVKALASDTTIYCDEFDDSLKKGCEETFIVNLMWRELLVTPKGLRAVLVENGNMGFCGSAGCSLNLFIQQPDSQFIQTLGTAGDVGSLDEVKVLRSTTASYYDIQKTWADGKTYTIYKWRGSEYSAE